MAATVRPVSAIQPVTFYVPSSAAEPVELGVAHSGLRMALVTRESARLLTDDWRVLGIYFLLGPHPDDADKFCAYVGEVGRRDLLLRISEHAAQKDWWSRALLVASASAGGFNSAEIGWLEGRFYDVLQNAVAAKVMNKGRPGDDSIALKDRGVLERYVEPTMAALRAVGAPPDTADQKPPPMGKKRAHYRESLKDLIDADLLKPGTRLRPTRKNLTTTALVLPDGSLDVGGTAYGAVSQAARAVTGSQSEPGWEFWGAPSGDGSFVSLFTLRERLRIDPPPAQRETRVAPPAVTPPAPPFVAALITRVSRRRFAGSVADLLAAGLMAAGQRLHGRNHGADVEATVLASGEIQYGSASFASPSAAAKAVTGNRSEPGWDFWTIDEDGARVTLSRLRERLRAPESTQTGRAPATGGGD